MSKRRPFNEPIYPVAQVRERLVSIVVVLKFLLYRTKNESNNAHMQKKRRIKITLLIRGRIQ